MVVLDGKNKKSPLPVIMAKREIDKGTRSFKIEVSYLYDVENLKILCGNQGYTAKCSPKSYGYLVTLTAKDF